MNTALIEVKTAEPPREGKKTGVVRTVDGATFLVFPDKLGLLRPGKTYEVQFSERDWQGQTYRTIVRCTPKDQPASAPANPVAVATGHLGELEFVARLLAASIQACAVGHTKEDLVKETKMWRAVYRESF